MTDNSGEDAFEALFAQALGEASANGDSEDLDGRAALGAELTTAEELEIDLEIDLEIGPEPATADQGPATAARSDALARTLFGLWLRATPEAQACALTALASSDHPELYERSSPEPHCCSDTPAAVCSRCYHDLSARLPEPAAQVLADTIHFTSGLLADLPAPPDTGLRPPAGPGSNPSPATDPDRVTGPDIARALRASSYAGNERN